MMTSTSTDLCSPSRVNGWTFDDIHLEIHHGNPTPLPPHSHDSYQIGLTTRDPGVYYCCGAELAAPPGSLLLFHPGEIHAAVGRASLRLPTMPARIMFLTPEKLRAVAMDVSQRELDLPFFRNRIIGDERFVRRFARLHELLESGASTLEKEYGILSLLETLVTRYGSIPPAKDSTRNQAKAKVVRDYIDMEYSANLSLAQLAALAHTSPFHMNRVFKREVGMPPHAYQTQVRIEHAKSLLVRGVSVTEVAVRTGFFDQSHLTHHFRRVVGVSPGSYARPN